MVAGVQVICSISPSVAGHAVPEPAAGVEIVYVLDFFVVAASQPDQQDHSPTQAAQLRNSEAPADLGQDVPVPSLACVIV